MNWLLEPLQYEFMQSAMTMGIVVGVLCPTIGAFLVVQRLSLLGNTIAHAVLPGLAIAHVLGAPLLVGAFISGGLSTFAIAWIQTQTRVKSDSAMSLTLVSFFAIGVMLIDILDSRLALEDLLFGNILSVTPAEVRWTATIAAIVLIGVAVFYQELLFFSFDRRGAEAAGLPVRVIQTGFVAAVAVAIVAGMQAVGVILVISLLVGPALTAYLLVKELHWIVLLGTGFGIASSLAGMYLSFYFDVPSGPAIAIVAFGLFLTALFSTLQPIKKA